jgi:putative phosphoribosyl transferase
MQLAKELEKYKFMKGVVLAIPRGGVPVGNIVAKELGMPLDIILSKKIGHPFSPEFAVGSVCLNGDIIYDSIPGVSMNYIQEESARLLKILKGKYKKFMGNRQPVDLKNKIVIVVDDGIATGNTILATVESLKKSMPKKIIVAAPVASTSSVSKLSKEVDEVISILVPEDFIGVGGYYRDFSQVSDEEVIRLLDTATKMKDIV